MTASLASEEPDDDDDELFLLQDDLRDLLPEADLVLEGNPLLVDDLLEDLLLGDGLLARKDLLLDVDRLLVTDLSLLDELEGCLLLEGETILLLFLGLGAGALPPRASPSLSELLPCGPLGCLGCILSILTRFSEVKTHYYLLRLDITQE